VRPAVVAVSELLVPLAYTVLAAALPIAIRVSILRQE